MTEQEVSAFDWEKYVFTNIYLLETQKNSMTTLKMFDKKNIILYYLKPEGP